MASKILIVEDDPDSARLVGLYLQRDGHRVLTAEDGIEGLRMARQARPDLVVLDLMLPRLDGLEVCRTLRKESDMAIVMVTARVEEEDRLTGLDLGADDYVTKPFSPKELAYGEINVDLRTRAVLSGSTELTLTPTEFRLLVMLIREPGRTFTRNQIIDRVFGYDFDGFDRTVDAHIANLRRKLKSNGDKAPYIHTIYGVGYRFGDA